MACAICKLNQHNKEKTAANCINCCFQIFSKHFVITVVSRNRLENCIKAHVPIKTLRSSIQSSFNT